jgi:oligopeptide transport system substrate-binding protein
MHRLLGIVAALAIVAIATTTLFGGARPFAQHAAAQEITINALHGEPDTIDPTLTSFSTEATVVRQVFEPLLRFDAELRPQPAAASSYEVSADGRSWTFHLRADGRWSDGVPVRAADFEYSFKRLLDPSSGAQYADFFVGAGITDVRAVDERTLTIDLEAPFGPLDNLVALWVASPLRQDIVERYGNSWATTPETYVGNGPFMLTEWIHQDHMTFVPNPRYHGPAATLKKMTLLMVNSDSADYAAYLNNERDWTLLPDADVATAAADPTLAGQLRSFSLLNTLWINVNTAAAPLDNALVRQALSRAIDRQALIRDIASGVGTPATSIIPPGMPGHQPELGKDIDFDPAAAADLLRQAGYASAAEFPKLTYTFATTPANQRRAEFIQAQLKQNLGIDLQLESLEPKAFQAAFRAGTYQLAFGAWGADYPDPQNWFSGNFGCGAGNNKYNYCNPEFDALAARADRSVDQAERLQLYAAAQAVLAHDLPVIPLYYRGQVALVKPWVQGLVMTAQDEYPGSLFLDQVSIAGH